MQREEAGEMQGTCTDIVDKETDAGVDVMGPADR